MYTNRSVVSTDHKSYTKENISEAFDAVNFNVKLPNYVPKGYEMQGAFVYNTNGDISIEIDYKHGKSKGFELWEAVIEDTLESTLTKSKGFVWEEIQINQYQAFKQFSDSTDEKSLVVKKEGNMYYRVDSSNLDFDELIEILKSI